jgi:aryl-alcohol dehydrogenase-like predicted oxidoreductase
MELALGTVQFGLRYGVAGRGTAVPPVEVRAILERAHALGIRVLDTAAAYGDIEPRLAALADGLSFRIVSKLPPCPDGLNAEAAAAWAIHTLTQSRSRLGLALGTMLFHRAEDLLESRGDALWAACAPLAIAHGMRLGVSSYDSVTFERVRARFPVTIAQLPGNALDQRLRVVPTDGDTPLELHLRSAFLQGLLLMPEAEAARRVPAAAPALARWHAWCCARGHSALVAALGIVKGLPGVSHCVVGVNDLPQLEQIATAWAAAPALKAPELHTDDPDTIDPRRWPALTGTDPQPT